MWLVIFFPPPQFTSFFLSLRCPGDLPFSFSLTLTMSLVQNRARHWLMGGTVPCWILLYLQVSLSEGFFSRPVCPAHCFSLNTAPLPSSRQAAEQDGPVKPAFSNCIEWYPRLRTFSLLRTRKQSGTSSTALLGWGPLAPIPTGFIATCVPPWALTRATHVPLCLCESGHH